LVEVSGGICKKGIAFVRSTQPMSRAFKYKSKAARLAAGPCFEGF
jgi:hypothetical protein